MPSRPVTPSGYGPTDTDPAADASGRPQRPSHRSFRSRTVGAALLSITFLGGFGQMCEDDVPADAPLPVTDPDNAGDWVLSEGLSDEFNGTTIDDDKWRVVHACNRPKWCWAPDRITVADGSMSIGMDYTDEYEQQKYESAMVRSDKGSDHFVKYGYLEARIKATDLEHGVPAAFWLWRNTPTTGTEIDIAELQQWGINRIGHARHLWKHPTDEPLHENFNWQADWFPGDDFHVYGLEWTPDEMKWYVDGELTRTMPTQPYYNQPMIIMLSLGLRQPYTYEPTPEGFETHMYVDYLRVWK